MSNTSFNDFSLPEPILRAVQAMKFTAPTPIQSKAIPVVMAGKDLIGCAQTGTGKTAAFGIPLLCKLLANSTSAGLILAPTRELAQQIELALKSLAQFSTEMRMATLIGGMSMEPQVRKLRQRPRVIIATPGRLLDHLERRNVNLSNVAMLVLDEADRMLDMGFAPQLNQILKLLPKTRQTVLFSATWASSLDSLAARNLRNPERVTIGTTNQAAHQIEQTVIQTTHQKKNELLLDEINKTKGSVLIFTRTKARTDRVTKYLHSYGVQANRLHGGRTQGQRNSALQGFRQGRPRVLVATDIAARGIDVAKISHIINYDLPQCSEDYIHRIGRTARAGASGHAISFVTPEDKGQWKEILRHLKRSGSKIPQFAQTKIG